MATIGDVEVGPDSARQLRASMAMHQVRRSQLMRELAHTNDKEAIQRRESLIAGVLRRMSLSEQKEPPALKRRGSRVAIMNGTPRGLPGRRLSNWSLLRQNIVNDADTQNSGNDAKGRRSSKPALITRRNSTFMLGGAQTSPGTQAGRRFSLFRQTSDEVPRLLRRGSHLARMRSRRILSLDSGKDAADKNMKKSGIPKFRAQVRSLMQFYVRLAKVVDNFNNEPLIRFRRAVRIVQTLLRALTTSDREARLRNSELKFLLYAADDPVGSSIGGSGLYFDPSYYRAKKDMQLSPDAKQILSMPPEERTEEQKKIALLSLKSAVEAFAEFPIRMQRSLVSVGWYESYEASRVIIRQGHHAENFYMILTGTAVVTLSSQDAKTGETKVQTVAFLKKGNSFGELAIMHHSRRTATVSCQDGVELLAVGREDFVDIFMHRGDGNEPEFIQYLRTMEEFSGWPISRLPQDDPKICLYMYFRRGVVICKDSNKADWVYIVKSGTCRVLKKLQEVHPDIRGLRSLVPDAQMDLISPRSRSTASRHTPFPKGYKSRPSTQPNFRPSPEPQRKKSLPSIQIKSPDQVDRERVEFQKKLEEQRPETRPNGVAQENIARSEFEYPRSRRPPKTVYVQLQKLVEKDTFGLIPLILGEIEGGSMSTALVSDGAECILINKKFFLQHLTQKHRKKLRLMLRPYPTESSLQQRLQDQTNWQAYKSMMLSTFPSFSPSEQTLYL